MDLDITQSVGSLGIEFELVIIYNYLKEKPKHIGYFHNNFKTANFITPVNYVKFYFINGFVLINNFQLKI